MGFDHDVSPSLNEHFGRSRDFQPGLDLLEHFTSLTD